MSAPSPAALVGDPDWLLAAIDGSGRRYLFARVTRETYRRSPFLDRRIEPKPTAVEWIPMERVHRALAAAPAPAAPACYIFHSAFCCSTLLASCLQHDRRVLALKEPTALATTATAKRVILGGGAAGAAARWGPTVEPILRLLHKRYEDTPQLVIKPSNYCNNLVPDVMEGTDNRCLFLTGSLPEFIRSVLKKPAGSGIEALLDDFLAAFSRDSAFLGRAVATLGPPEKLADKAALVWSHQIDWLAGFAGRWPGRMRALTAGELLGAPVDSLAAVLSHFRISTAGGSEARRQAEAIVAEGPFRQDPKAARSFSADARAREDVAVERRHGEAIDAALAWQAELIRRVPIRSLVPETTS